MRKILLITGVSPNSIGQELLSSILRVNRISKSPSRWTFLVAQRDPSSLSSRHAIDRLKRELGTLDSVHTVPCDLGCLESVRTCASSILSLLHHLSDSNPTFPSSSSSSSPPPSPSTYSAPRDIKTIDTTETGEMIDIMVLNAAAVYQTGPQSSSDHLEKTFAVNHVGHFLLLQLLKDHIRRRVVFVTSELHKRVDATKLLRKLRDPNGFGMVEQDGESEGVEVKRVGYRGLSVYSESKLLQAYCLPRWHELFAPKGVSVALSSPGFVPSSGLSRDTSASGRFFMRYILSWAPFARTLRQGGDSVAAAAIDPELARTSNVFLNKDLKEERMHEDVYNHEHAKLVWDWTVNAAHAEELV